MKYVCSVSSGSYSLVVCMCLFLELVMTHPSEHVLIDLEALHMELEDE